MDAARFICRQPIAYRPRHGVTLIELLIVFSILAMVTAAAIPMMLPALEGRRIRESARQINAFFAGGRHIAIENGRPAGVLIERFNGQPYSMNLSYVEVPVPYAGDTQTSRAALNPAINYQLELGSPPVATPDTGWKGLLRWGDQIKFNYQGRMYRLWNPGWTTPTDINTHMGQLIAPADPLMIVNADGTAYAPPPLPAAGVPFQIFRQPVKSAAPPLQLGEGTVIDLVWSGDSSVTPLSGNPMIIFSPDGAVDSFYNGPVPNRPNAAVFFLIGRSDAMVSELSFPPNQIPYRVQNPASNLNDLNNLWVAVSPQTGQITTTENVVVSVSTPFNPSDSSTWTVGRMAALQAARKLAQSGQGMGGR